MRLLARLQAVADESTPGVRLHMAEYIATPTPRAAAVALCAKDEDDGAACDSDDATAAWRTVCAPRQAHGLQLSVSSARWQSAPASGIGPASCAYAATKTYAPLGCEERGLAAGGGRGDMAVMCERESVVCPMSTVCR